MKRQPTYLPEQTTWLDLPLEELEILLGDEEQLLRYVGADLLQCNCCGLHAPSTDTLEIHLEESCCLFLVQACPYCKDGQATAFVDTTDLADWQHILRNLLRQQSGLNSLGDE
jgi:hypothetical protein